MTGKQARSLLRKAKMVIVIGAAAYLAIGIGSLGQTKDEFKQEKKVTENHSVQMTEVQFVATVKPVEEPTEETEYQSAIYSYDWDADESEMLCKIAMAEAENQDTEGKALVMLVVLNRVWGDEFPNSIEEVIYQPKQFSPVLEGKFESAEPNEDCWKALEMVMLGWDESNGALYFESKSNSTWHEDNLKFLFKHQDHYFYTDKER